MFFSTLFSWELHAAFKMMMKASYSESLTVFLRIVYYTHVPFFSTSIGIVSEQCIKVMPLKSQFLPSVTLHLENKVELLVGKQPSLWVMSVCIHVAPLQQPQVKEKKTEHIKKINVYLLPDLVTLFQMPVLHKHKVRRCTKTWQSKTTLSCACVYSYFYTMIPALHTKTVSRYF